MSRRSDPDLLALAEEIAAGRRSMADAEARVATDAERAELRSLVRALGAVRAHAEATRMAPPVEAPAALDVARRPVNRQPVRGRSSRSLVGGLALGLAVVLVVGVVALSLSRPTPVGPAASAAPSPSPAATPLPSAAATPAPTPGPTSLAADGLPPIESWPLPAPNLAFWMVDGETIHILLWDPMTSEMVETATVESWTGDTIERTVLFPPNGAHFAVHEIDITTSSPVQRLRVFDFNGDLVWEPPANERLPIVTGMAWSPDGTALAIGSLPAPWTVVQLSETGAEPDVTSYELDREDGYALLGFSVDGNSLYGYGTGGEAEYWQKLVSVDRATGRLSRIASIPPGLDALSWANSTALVDRFRPDGSILIQQGLARGDPAWAVRLPSGEEEPIPVDPSAQVASGPDRQIVRLGTDLRLDVVDAATGEAPAARAYAFPDGDYRADLRGARDGYALVLLEPAPSFAPNAVVIVEIATGRAAVGLPPAALRASELGFAGWLGRRN